MLVPSDGSEPLCSLGRPTFAPEALQRDDQDEAFSPGLAKLVRQAPAGDAWLHEVKWDGYRIVATVVEGKVRLRSRNGIEWIDKAPELAKAVSSLKLNSALGRLFLLR